MAQVHQASCNIPAMRLAIERGLAINPDDPSLLGVFGNWLAYAGHWDEGVALVDRALRLQPDSHPSWWLFTAAKPPSNPSPSGCRTPISGWAEGV